MSADDFLTWFLVVLVGGVLMHAGLPAIGAFLIAWGVVRLDRLKS